MKDKKLRLLLEKMEIIHWFGKSDLFGGEVEENKITDKDLRKALSDMEIIKDYTSFIGNGPFLVLERLKEVEMKLSGLMKHLDVEEDGVPLISMKKKNNRPLNSERGKKGGKLNDR